MVSPHQPTSLSDRITKLKKELELYEGARDQILILGQTTSAAGSSTTYGSLNQITARIDFLTAQIAALTAQLVGDPAQPPGLVFQQYRSDYCG